MKAYFLKPLVLKLSEFACCVKHFLTLHALWYRSCSPQHGDSSRTNVRVERKTFRNYGSVVSQTVLLKLSHCFGVSFSHLTGSFRLGSNVLWVISLSSCCWSAVKLRDHPVLYPSLVRQLKSIEITELGIPTKPLIHSDSFEIRRETQPALPLKKD